MRWAALLAFFAVVARAEDSDEAALALADRTVTQAPAASDWRLYAEGAQVRSEQRADGAVQHSQRLSLDAYVDTAAAPRWRAVFADRLDLRWRGAPAYGDFINTLKEAYVSGQPANDAAFDIGRVNARYGVASGYNPTDYFRANAVRSIVSINPASLRENRLGTVMLRGQRLWSSGSLTALYAPRLTEERNTSPFSPDFGATNNQWQGLVALSQKLAPDFSPQWLLYDNERGEPQLGMNATTLWNDATVAYLEWSGGRQMSQVAQALGQSEERRFRSRLATGATYTAPNKLSVTLEYDYNGAAPDEAQWNALRQGAPDLYAQYRSRAAAQQDLPTRRNLFLYARWQDFLIPRLELSAMLRLDAVDESRLAWIEVHRDWGRVNVALQWQRNVGEAGSQFGALPERQVWQLAGTYFF